MLFQSTPYAFTKLFTISSVNEDKSVGQIKNALERGFVKHWLNSVEITGPKCFKTHMEIVNNDKMRVMAVFSCLESLS